METLLVVKTNLKLLVYSRAILVIVALIKVTNHGGKTMKEISSIHRELKKREHLMITKIGMQIVDRITMAEKEAAMRVIAPEGIIKFMVK